MKVLITGVSGFVGQQLAQLLSSHAEVHGISRSNTSLATSEQYLAVMHIADVCDQEAMSAIIEKVKPNAVVHLAAQAHVGTSFHDPWPTLETNIKGTLVILQALSPHRNTKLLLASSGEVYGITDKTQLPITEDHLILPSSPYGVSKRTQELLVQQCAFTEGQQVVIARPFNHIGPGQSTRFALPNFAEQIARIEVGLAPPVLKVGNLDAERDVTDVRDVCRAYELLLMNQTQHMIYNIASGRAKRIGDLVEQMLAMAKVKINVEMEQSRVRSIDVPSIYANASRMHNEFDWKPEIMLEQTLQDILDYARHVVSTTH